MTTTSLWNTVENAISAATGERFAHSQARPVGGGSINEAYALVAGDQRAFVKLNQAPRLAMFEAEAEGLNTIAASGTVRVPRALAWGTHAEHAYIALEYLELGQGRNSASLLGEQLAQMHRHTQAQYGWLRDNTIGSTPQLNSLSSDWLDFFQRLRLGYQLQLAAKHGYRGKLLDKGERLMADMGALFANYRPPASLLHGDLWAGNYANDARGRPVIFDPAVYFGDRETDIAMTELFGGFGADFYAAYNAHYPLDTGYRVRKTLYNLYHVLNHLNLFGGGYGAQAEHMLDQLLSELRG